MKVFAWDLLQQATSSRSLYLFGAGASAPEIKMGAALSNSLREDNWANGIFPTTVQPTSAVKEAILDPSTALEREGSLIAQEELDALTHPDLLELLLARSLTVRGFAIPPQYKIFDFFWPSVIFNFNVDNLADALHPKHEVYYPHGKISAAFAHSTVVGRAIAFLNISPRVVARFDYWRPIPESPSITSAESYQSLKRVFPSLNYVVVIGYSFGTWQGRMHQNQSSGGRSKIPGKRPLKRRTEQMGAKQPPSSSTSPGL